jgi:hypothetical protein
MPKVKRSPAPPRLKRLAAARVLRKLSTVRPHAGIIVEATIIDEDECDGINSHRLSELTIDARKVLEKTRVEGYVLIEDSISSGRMVWGHFCRQCAMRVVTSILELECPT